MLTLTGSCFEPGRTGRLRCVAKDMTVCSQFVSSGARDLCDGFKCCNLGRDCVSVSTVLSNGIPAFLVF